MNLSCVLLLILMLAIPFVGMSQQPTAILRDEHGNVPCDESLGRLDAFFSDLSSHPDSSGLVSISSSLEYKVRSVFRQEMIEQHTKSRGFDASRFKIVRADSEQKTNVQFWLIPPGAAEPKIKGMDMSYTLPQGSKPFMLGYETVIGDQICPPVSDAAVFARFLKENRSARGNIVIRDDSRARARRRADRILKTLGRFYGIRRSRLNIFIARREGPRNYYGPILEYWFLP
jgi:hypothetical protein